jgi:hypothetical protein
MFFIDHKKVIDVLIGYVCLFLPSILLANIFIGYRPHFFSRTYYNIRQSIQAVGNGIVFLLGVLDAIKLALLLQLDLLLCRGDHGGGQTIQAQIVVRHNAGDLPDIHTDDNSARE